MLYALICLQGVLQFEDLPTAYLGYAAKGQKRKDGGEIEGPSAKQQRQDATSSESAGKGNDLCVNAAQHHTFVKKDNFIWLSCGYALEGILRHCDLRECWNVLSAENLDFINIVIFIL